MVAAPTSTRLRSRVGPAQQSLRGSAFGHDVGLAERSIRVRPARKVRADLDAGDAALVASEIAHPVSVDSTHRKVPATY